MKREYKATARQVGKTPLRAIRIQTELWDSAKAKAAESGQTISDVVREALEAYVKPSD